MRELWYLWKNKDKMWIAWLGVVRFWEETHLGAKDGSWLRSVSASGDSAPVFVFSCVAFAMWGSLLQQVEKHLVLNERTFIYHL